MARSRVFIFLIISGALMAIGGAGYWLWQVMESETSWAEIGISPGLVIAVLGVSDALVGLLLYGRELSNRHDTPATFLTPEEDAAVVKAIEVFEKKTSGELRVHLETKLKDSNL